MPAVAAFRQEGYTIWHVTDPDKDPPQTLLVCLEAQIGVDFSKRLELSPEQIVVVRDLALDDTAAANLALQCRLKDDMTVACQETAMGATQPLV